MPYVATLAAAVLLAVTSLAGLIVEDVYARETAAWAEQAIVQDWFDLLIAAPLLAASAYFAALGSRRARLVAAGLLLFAIYTMAIYCFSIHLNALFVLYCATFGGALFAAIGVAADLLLEGAPRSIRHERLAGGFLIAVGLAFAGMWLAQLVPAMVTGRIPQSLAEANLPTNPVHVLDLSFILPLHVAAGIAAWRGTRLGAVLAPIVLAFGALMAASIACMAPLPVAIAMAIVAAVSTWLLVAMLRRPVR